MFLQHGSSWMCGDLAGALAIIFHLYHPHLHVAIWPKCARCDVKPNQSINQSTISLHQENHNTYSKPLHNE